MGGGGGGGEALHSLEVVVYDVSTSLPLSSSASASPLCVGVRLLSFPVLLIRPPPPATNPKTGADVEFGRYPFGTGKSALFRCVPSALAAQLAAEPLYLLVMQEDPGE